MTTAETKRKLPRRWLRFSLRTLLAFMVVASIGLAWLGNTLLRIRKQRAIVAQIEAAGGQVFFSHQFPVNGRKRVGDPPGPKLLRWWLGENAFAQVRWVNVDEDFMADGLRSVAALRDIEKLNAVVVSDDSLSHLEGLTKLKDVSFAGDGFTSRGLQELARLPRLERVELYKTSVNDDGLAHLVGLKELRFLSLGDNNLTDECLQHLVTLPKLERLNLAYTHVTDEGMETIAKFPQLRTLKIHDTAVTDLGVKKLATMEQLDWVLIGPHVSRQAAAELKRALPNCAIWGYDKAGEFKF